MCKIILLGAVWTILLATGCGGHKYSNAEVSKSQLDRDNADCQWQAAQATGNLTDDSQRKDRLTELFDKCMKNKGYEK